MFLKFSLLSLKCGYSPLHGAAYCGHQNVVIDLLKYGANPDSIDKDGNDPATISSLKGFETLSEMIASQQSITY